MYEYNGAKPLSKIDEVGPRATLKSMTFSCHVSNSEAGRRLWKDYVSHAKIRRQSGSTVDVILYFQTNKFAISGSDLGIRVEGKFVGLLGNVTKADADKIKKILIPGCEYWLTAYDIENYRTGTAQFRLTYVIDPVKTEKKEEKVASEAISWNKFLDNMKTPEIVDFACEFPYARVEIITKELADRMLEHNVKNRDVKPGHVTELENHIRSGHFTFTNQSIGFNRKGELIDGQHRLMAISRCGVPVPMVVVYGADQSLYLDRGRSRRTIDNLKTCFDGEFSVKVVAMINQLYRVETGRHNSLDETKMYIAYEHLRDVIDAPALRSTYYAPKAMFGAHYTAALAILQMSGKFSDEDLRDVNSLMIQGIHEEGMPNKIQDRMVAEVREMVLSSKHPFIKKGLTRDIDIDITKTITFLRSMLPYLMGTKTRRTAKDAEDFCHKVLGGFFSEVERDYYESGAKVSSAS